jgi:patatin-like phospholipase/acyl hydrolase
MATTPGPGTPRSAGAIPQRRIPQPWPKDRRFRILSLDGGGIRGIYPATVLAELERHHTGGRRIGDYFDLIAGTSTGGILALGMGAGLSASELRDLYLVRGCEIFPERKRSIIGRVKAFFQRSRHWLLYLYDRDAISRVLDDAIGTKLFGESLNRLCIPSFDGTNSDRFQPMKTVALATSAAPTFFRPFQDGGYNLVDGGVWANNPLMLAVIEALICFDIRPEQIDVLSIGCGEDPYVVSKMQMWGGKIFWADSIFAAMRLQSMAATNQARLLLGPPSVIRLLPSAHTPPIDMDDWARAKDLLPPDALATVQKDGQRIAQKFFATSADPYVPVPVSPSNG